MGLAILVGLIASSTLVIGATVGAYWNAPKWIIGTVLAFASGALITSVAFELFERAEETGGLWYAGIGLLIGAGTYVVADTLIEKYAASRSGGALLASITLDGIPENLALGVALIGTGFSEILALMVAISVSNLPESLGGAAGMREGGYSRFKTIGIWSATATLLAVAVVVGNLTLRETGGETLAIIRATAAGAVLASLADEVMPEAYRDTRHPAVAMATAAGFFLTFALK